MPDANPWVDIDLAATHLAGVFDGRPPDERRRSQWRRRIWTWMHRAQRAGKALPTTRREGRRVLYRLAELQAFAEQHASESELRTDDL